MNILVIGSGGREHALVWKIAGDSRVNKLYCAPGNPGMKEAELVKIDASDDARLLSFAKEKNIDLTVVGPEVPLVNGIVDLFNSNGLRIFGPTSKAAQLEGSKTFAKEFMSRHSIPTAEYERFDKADDAFQYVRKDFKPCVVKASGLAAGKGAVVCNTVEQAEKTINQMMVDNIFGDAGDTVIIENLLEGEEASIFAISDGNNFVILPSSQDHKRVFDNDEGPNTGGMGAYSPAPVVSDSIYEEVKKTILTPVIEGMKSEGSPFCGLLYAGVIISDEGPKVIEFNVRFGDPEAQVVIPIMGEEFLDLLIGSADGDITGINLSNNTNYASTIVLSSGGYPGNYETGQEIHGLDYAFEKDTMIFHSGTKEEDNKYYTNGGRVLTVTSLGDSLERSIENSYAALSHINFDGMHYRKDIGQKGLDYISNGKMK
ncbi:MAG: phosphoribosylamine--glycine ligase [Candidatus Marinimicrobia bacterium]|nr:phosphoribosylamine--glycine ligase [Candidatus Neomarinimicrobiota bacterium]